MGKAKKQSKSRSSRREGRRGGGGRGPKNKTTANVQGGLEAKQAELAKLKSELAEMQDDNGMSDFIDSLVECEGLSASEAAEKYRKGLEVLGNQVVDCETEIRNLSRKHDQAEKDMREKELAKILKQSKQIGKDFLGIAGEAVEHVKAICTIREKLKILHAGWEKGRNDFRKVREVLGQKSFEGEGYPPLDMFLNEIEYFAGQKNWVRQAVLFGDLKPTSVTVCPTDPNTPEMEALTKAKEEQGLTEESRLKEIKQRASRIHLAKTHFLQRFGTNQIPATGDMGKTHRHIDGTLLFADGEMQWGNEDELEARGKELETALPVAELAGV